MAFNGPLTTEPASPAAAHPAPMTMTTELLRTPLHDWHVKHGGRMVDFAGWSMPVQYTSIADEHNATRNSVGVFDISHMGRLQFLGPDFARFLAAIAANPRPTHPPDSPIRSVAAFLDSVVTRRVSDLKSNQIRYALICNEQGGILDDVLVYGSSSDEFCPYSMVVNASNREKIVAWLKDSSKSWQHHSKEEFPISIGDNTVRSAMIAVQGPKALDVLAPFFNAELSAPSLDLHAMRYYHWDKGYFEGISVVVSRTGYTGEDGVEIMCEAEQAAWVWEQIATAAEKVGGMAAGLGARDTLRLEAAMPLYGHELSETINPIQAGLNFAVNLDGREFIGSDALKRFATDKSQPVRVGLQGEGKRVPRQGCPVLHEGKVVGEVTSGTYSPTLDRPIAMAYVEPSASAVGTQLTTDIRGTQHSAVVVPLPFYQRQKQKN